MPMNLYRRHRQDCEAGRQAEFRSGEFEEHKKGWKRCACHIFASGTIHHVILDELRKASGVDFRQYKPNAIHRRALRRAVILKLDRLDEYTQFLKEHPEDGLKLYDDVLIPVTIFFRGRSLFGNSDGCDTNCVEGQLSSVPLVSMDRARASPGLGGSWHSRKESREPESSHTPENSDRLWR
jgi:CheR methyltransferase, all-alpha domain